MTWQVAQRQVRSAAGNGDYGNQASNDFIEPVFLTPNGEFAVRNGMGCLIPENRLDEVVGPSGYHAEAINYPTIIKFLEGLLARR